MNAQWTQNKRTKKANMDIIDQINALEDHKLRELLTHSVRYAMQHSLIAAQVAQLPNADAQSQQAIAIHGDTNMLLMELTKRVLADNKPTSAPKAKKAAKRK